MHMITRNAERNRGGDDRAPPNPIEGVFTVLDLLGARRLPFLARRNYRIEVCHLFHWGVIVGLIEGNIGSIVVDKTFGGGSLLVAAASATPIGAQLLSIIWGSLAVGRQVVDGL